QIRVDGYKNLFNCKVDLYDFKVLVGPNNSGKTNLIEALQLLYPIGFYSGDFADDVLSGYVRLSERVTSSISHLNSYANSPLTLAICFEMDYEKKRWVVDYEVKIQCGDSKKIKAGYLHEKLKAKPKLQTGPFTTFLSRTPELLKVNKKEIPLARGVSAFNAIRTLFPKFKNMPIIFNYAIKEIIDLSFAPVFAIDPKVVRSEIDSNKDLDNWHISSFDPLLEIDLIKEEGQNYEIFTEVLCQILNIEDIDFEAVDIKAPQTKSKQEPASKRSRLMTIKQKGHDYVNIEEFSDGTIAVVALLAGILSPERKSPLIFIEELENYLHPAAISKLLQFLQDYSSECQVVITTHSPYLLNGVNPEDVNVAVVDETGATQFEKLSNRKKIEDRLKHGFMDFGDLLVNNYEEIING
ncbi:MAG: AAA family ATPase, partial [Phycisphaerae bacterium]|nr:AAA family ATPase [Phycisphaerae bacterium]